MEVAGDGSPVEVYRRLPPLGEPEIVHAAVPRGCAILELGCGAGRVTHALVALGHPVVAVDNSPEMLAHVRDAETVLADVEGLDLGRRFPAVVLGSNFVNDPDPGRRTRLLGTCSRHVAPDGRVLIECYDAAFDWEAAVGSERRIGDVTLRVAAARRAGSLVSATMEYEVEGARWSQSFTATALNEDELRASLSGAGLSFERWLDASGRWFSARPGTD